MQVVHAFSSPIADATGTLTIWNGATTASVIATENVRPSDWNSLHNMQQDIAGNTAGVSSVSGTNIVFAGGNNITLSGAGAAITISGPHTSQFLTTAALSNHNHDAQYASLGHTHDDLYQPIGAYLTTAALSNHSHGNPTLALTNISGTTASNSAGLTLSLSAAAPGGGGAGNTISYFANAPQLADALSSQIALTSHIMPFVLPGAISVDYLRFAVSATTNSTSLATTADTTFSNQKASTFAAMVYKQMTGASSLSLESVASGSAGYTQAWQIGANAAGSQYTVSMSVTYPITGGTSSYSTSYATSQTRFDFSTGSLTLFTGTRFLDIPFANSLPQSNYWLCVGHSTSVTSEGNAALSNLVLSPGIFICISNQNNAFREMGQTFLLGQALGVGRVNVAAITTASLVLSNISTVGNGFYPYFQMIRQA